MNPPNQDCEKILELIAAAPAGEVLPASVLDHMETCPECAEVLALEDIEESAGARDPDHIVPISPEAARLVMDSQGERRVVNVLRVSGGGGATSLRWFLGILILFLVPLDHWIVLGSSRSRHADSGGTYDDKILLSQISPEAAAELQEGLDALSSLVSGKVLLQDLKELQRVGILTDHQPSRRAGHPDPARPVPSADETYQLLKQWQLGHLRISKHFQKLIIQTSYELELLQRPPATAGLVLWLLRDIIPASDRDHPVSVAGFRATWDRTRASEIREPLLMSLWIERRPGAHFRSPYDVNPRLCERLLFGYLRTPEVNTYIQMAKVCWDPTAPGNTNLTVSEWRTKLALHRLGHILELDGMTGLMRALTDTRQLPAHLPLVARAFSCAAWGLGLFVLAWLLLLVWKERPSLAASARLDASGSEARFAGGAGLLLAGTSILCIPLGGLLMVVFPGLVASAGDQDFGVLSIELRARSRELLRYLRDVPGITPDLDRELGAVLLLAAASTLTVISITYLRRRFFGAPRTGPGAWLAYATAPLVLYAPPDFGTGRLEGPLLILVLCAGLAALLRRCGAADRTRLLGHVAGASAALLAAEILGAGSSANSFQLDLNMWFHLVTFTMPIVVIPALASHLSARLGPGRAGPRGLLGGVAVLGPILALAPEMASGVERVARIWIARTSMEGPWPATVSWGPTLEAGTSVVLLSTLIAWAAMMWGAQLAPEGAAAAATLPAQSLILRWPVVRDLAAARPATLALASLLIGVISAPIGLWLLAL